MAKLEILYHHLVYMLRTNLWVLPTGGTEKKFYSRRMDLQDDFLPAHETEIRSFFDEHQPVILQVGDGVLYGLVQSAEADYILGPVRCTDAFPLRFHITDGPGEELLRLLAPCSLVAFANHLLLLYDVFCEAEMSLEEGLLANSRNADASAMLAEFSDQTYVKRESEERHNPYDHEQREMYAIESGNLPLLRNTWTEVFTGSYGVTARDPIRNGRNLAIIVVALATRAAIRGGVLPEIAMSLGDVYMQRIEALQNIMEVGELTRSAEKELTLLVVEAKKHSSVSGTALETPLILRCKDYVYQHLHAKLTVQEIAEVLGVHPNYLSSSFKKSTGIPLYQYILEEKISLVKNLLTYSEYSPREIASTLGFSSQSHLGDVFRKSTGLTLMEYRRRYRKTGV